MLYKGYIKTKGKKAIEAFKDRTKYRTYDEVKNLEGFGGVLADDTILIDIDDAEQSEILMNIVEEYQLDCRVYCTSRGRHFLFKNHSITRNRTHVPLAVSNERIYQNITDMGYAKERITADSAEPKSIDQLKGYGLKVKGAEKGKDSINSGIQFIQDFEIIIHPRCVNFLTEISNYTWDKDKFGNKLNRPIDDFNHLMDAMRYALEKYIKKGSGWLYK